ncbi:N-acetylmuramoyl-L-alanine amidase [Oceanobacillus sp. J11TS1]|uniref:N-acetylmuramoyl-L-alanine amidase n=1 Tax=Oceanobacillus sp. J11TS1 TaxID=2807191 RepID=UPI001B1EE1BE|nr:N-acetylmuramoyl-L-alanine amidase [Oceanobacillus sp. J11TS1]GIO25078.1 hypothetical protein J11TS1_36590 [Oceanobacillus sp. J11TS1]
MLKVKKQIVSAGLASNVTYGGKNPINYITVHQTGNTNKGANAKVHAKLQSNGNSRAASWHYTVDDKEAYQSFEDTAQCWHCGDGQGPGNTQSIGVEICINSDGNYKKSVENGAKLVKQLMDKHNLTIDRVKQHYDWSGKNCPAQIRAGQQGVTWSDFINMVKGAKVSKPKETKIGSKQITKSIDQLADEVIAGKHGSGHANRRKSLGISQSEYDKVRAEVNKRTGSTTKPASKKSVTQMVNEVLKGQHGNGHAQRQKSLGISKSEYNKVKSEVNKRLIGAKPTSKSISQMATEVIQGKHGFGHENRRKSLGISKTEYEKVRKEVNKRL